MASNPKMEYQVFLCIFQKNSQRNFLISFKSKVAIAVFFWKMQRKTWYSILGVYAMPLYLKNLLLNMLNLMKLMLTNARQKCLKHFWTISYHNGHCKFVALYCLKSLFLFYVRLLFCRVKWSLGPPVESKKNVE